MSGKHHVFFLIAVVVVLEDFLNKVLNISYVQQLSVWALADVL